MLCTPLPGGSRRYDDGKHVNNCASFSMHACDFFVFVGVVVSVLYLFHLFSFFFVLPMYYGKKGEAKKS